MRPIEVLRFGFGGDSSVLVSGSINNVVRFHGASVPVAVEQGWEGNLFSFTLSSSQEEEVVALSVLCRNKVYSNRQKEAEWVDLLLRVYREGDKVFVDGESSFVPSVPVTFEHHQALVLVVGDERFTSSRYPKKGERRVDGNSICRFLAGTATADDVRAAASEAEVEQSLRERAEWLERRVEELKCDVATRQRLDATRCETIAQLRAQVERVRSFVRELVKHRVWVVRSTWVVQRFQQALATPRTPTIT